MQYGHTHTPPQPFFLQYPTEVMLKYPKVNTTNPTMSLWVQDLTDLSSSPVELTPPSEVTGQFALEDENFLYTAAKWTQEGGKVHPLPLLPYILQLIV